MVKKENYKNTLATVADSGYEIEEISKIPCNIKVFQA